MRKFAIDPFTNTIYNQTKVENHIVQLHNNINRYGIYLNEAPINVAPNIQVLFTDTSTPATEVAFNVTPSQGEFRVDYFKINSNDPYLGTGFIEFNASDNNRPVQVTYQTIGFYADNFVNYIESQNLSPAEILQANENIGNYDFHNVIDKTPHVLNSDPSLDITLKIGQVAYYNLTGTLAPNQSTSQFYSHINVNSTHFYEMIIFENNRNLNSETAIIDLLLNNTSYSNQFLLKYLTADVVNGTNYFANNFSWVGTPSFTGPNSSFSIAYLTIKLKEIFLFRNRASNTSSSPNVSGISFLKFTLFNSVLWQNLGSFILSNPYSNTINFNYSIYVRRLA